MKEIVKRGKDQILDNLRVGLVDTHGSFPCIHTAEEATVILVVVMNEYNQSL